MEQKDLGNFLEYITKVRDLIKNETNEGETMRKIIEGQYMDGLGSETDKLALFQAMSNADQIKLNIYYKNVIMPHMEKLLFELQPKLQLIKHLDRQIRLQKMAQYHQDPAEIHQYLNQIIKESENKMEKYLEDHSKINNYLFTNIFGIN
jgi:hypothetical protein